MKNIIRRMNITIHKRHKKVAKNNHSIEGKAMAHTHIEAEDACRSKIWLNKKQDNIAELLILCMEPFV